MKKKEFILGIIIFTLLNINLLTFNSFNPLNKMTSIDPKLSSFTIVSPFMIDDSNPTMDWAFYKSTYSWVSGSGTWDDPYVISGIQVSGSYTTTPIIITNSKKPFLIKDSIIMNASQGGLSGNIILFTVSNGEIENCSFENSQQVGMLLFTVDNFSIHDNFIQNVSTHGILNFMNNNISIYNNELSNIGYNESNGGLAVLLFNCANFDIFFNRIHDCINLHPDVMAGGIASLESENLTISYNYLDTLSTGIIGFSSNNSLYSHNSLNNCDFGIFCNNSKNNIIEHNTLTNVLRNLGIGSGFNCMIRYNVINHGEYGILLGVNFNDDNTYIINPSCHDNFVYGNYIYDCVNYSYDYSIGNNHWNNSETGNYWDNYNGFDKDDNGIGDTPYLITSHHEEGVNGTAIYDYLPIWDDGAEPFFPNIPDILTQNDFLLLFIMIPIIIIAIISILIIRRKRIFTKEKPRTKSRKKTIN